jgi:hypothetical protein
LPHADGFFARRLPPEGFSANARQSGTGDTACGTRDRNHQRKRSHAPHCKRHEDRWVTGRGREHFRSAAELSHQLPGETTILNPLHESVIPATSLTIQWSAVPDIREYILEFENESLDPEQALTVNLPAGMTSFEIPPALLVPGSDYQVGIQTVGENGNIVASEVTFSTAE